MVIGMPLEELPAATLGTGDAALELLLLVLTRIILVLGILGMLRECAR